MRKLNNDWDELLKDEFNKEYYQNLRKFIVNEYNTKTIYPKADDVLNCLRYTSYHDTKVVILGQDPYHNPHQAHGLSFSVLKPVVPPPSLKNIYKELNSDLGCQIPSHGELTKWAKQGVLLLNAVLTVEENKPGSHANKGWEIFTDHIIELLNQKNEPVVFLLWGNYAKQKEKLITNPKHLILKASHPSPFSAYHGFFDCHHFSKTNEFLIKNNLTPIDWQID